MSTPDISQESPSESAAPAPGNAAPVASPPARRVAEDDDGPQPGNRAAPAPNDDSEDDGPMPGNEISANAAASAAGHTGPSPAGTGKKRRSRNRRKGREGGAAHGAPGHVAGAEGAAGEGATGLTEGGEAAGNPPAEGAHAEGGGHSGPRRDRGERGDRNKGKRGGEARHGHRPHDRLTLNVGDVTFGKITEITDDALMIDLSGRGQAIFDRLELDLPDEMPGEEEAEEHDAEGEDAEVHAAAAGEPAAAEGEVSVAKVEAAAVVAEAPVAEVAATEAAAAETAPAEAKDEAHADASKDEAKKPAKKEQPVYGPLPPIVLEVGAYFVGIIHNDGGRGGLVVMTRHPRRVSKSKSRVVTALKENTLVNGLVTGVIKGGLEVDVDGLRAFAPGSHVDLHPGANLSHLVGKRLSFQVTQYGKRGRDVVLSRRALLEAEAKTSREEALRKIQVGAIVEGIVRSIVPFGAFIDIGGVDGLVPLGEMSHNRGDGPNDVFRTGEKTQVQIIKIDDKGKIWLSRKSAMADPWSEVAKKYALNTRHTARVARMQPFGVFVELEPGIDGLIHTSDLTLKKIEHPSEVISVGDAIDVVVAHLDMAGHRIGLHPAPSPEIAAEPQQKVAQYKSVKAVITSHDPGGILVRILGTTGRNARGYIPGAGTGTPRGTDLKKQFPVGQIIEAKVLEVDPKRAEVKLSMKALAEDTERTAYTQYRQQVSKESRFTFGDLLAKKGLTK